MHKEHKNALFIILSFPTIIALLFPYLFKSWFFKHNYQNWYYFFIALFISFGLMPAMYKLGLILKMEDVPGGRHIHTNITPRTGGIAIFIAFFATLNIITNPPPAFKAIFFSSALIAIVGIFDDLKHLPAFVKLIVQIIATILIINKGIVFSFFPNHMIGKIFSTGLTLFWVIGIINAINCIDGLDGLASGLSIIILTFLILLSNSMEDKFMQITSIILLGATIGFFPYNFRIGRPALIFLGDTGSTLLGFLLATLTLYGTWGKNKSIDLTIPILLLAVPIADMILTTITRIIEGKVRNIKEWFEYGGTDHIHHRLVAFGFRPKIAVLFLLTYTVIMGFITYLIKSGDLWSAIIALVTGILNSTLFFGLIAFKTMENIK